MSGPGFYQVCGGWDVVLWLLSRKQRERKAILALKQDSPCGGLNCLKSASGLRFLEPGRIGESKVKLVKKEGPTGLSRVQPLCIPDVVSVVHLDEEWVFGPLQPMPPFLKWHLNSQQLPVPSFIIPLSCGKPVREECTWVKLDISLTFL